MPPARRFPPPWSIEDIGAAFVVKDSAEQKLVCLLRGRARPALTRDEARRRCRELNGADLRREFANDRSEITSPLRSAATISPIWRPDSVSTAPF